VVEDSDEKRWNKENGGKYVEAGTAEVILYDTNEK
jgi:hypothetical protein